MGISRFFVNFEILLLLLERKSKGSIFLCLIFFLCFQNFSAQEQGVIYVIGDTKIITRENTSLKESCTENISKEVSQENSVKDDAKVVVKEITIKNSLAQTKKTNSEKYKNIEEKIKKNLQKTEYTNPFSSTGLANRAKSNANAVGTVFSLSKIFAPAICVYQSLSKKLDVLYIRKNYYYNHQLSMLNFSEQFSVRPPPFQV